MPPGPAKAAKTVGSFAVGRGAGSGPTTKPWSEENRLRTRPVVLVYEDAGFAYLQGGLKDGEVVITTKLIHPLEGRLLQVTFPDLPADAGEE